MTCLSTYTRKHTHTQARTHARTFYINIDQCGLFKELQDSWSYEARFDLKKSMEKEGGQNLEWD